MEQQVSTMIAHMAESQQKIARILQAERQTVLHIAQIVSGVEQGQIRNAGTETAIAAVSQIKKDVASYLNGLAELQQSLSGSLQLVMAELSEEPADE